MDIIKKRNEIAPITITPPSSLELPNFHELWEYKGLFFFLVRRDIKLRFQQTVIGFLWIILQPLIQLLIFYILFGVLVHIPTNGSTLSSFLSLRFCSLAVLHPGRQ